MIKNRREAASTIGIIVLSIILLRSLGAIHPLAYLGSATGAYPFYTPADNAPGMHVLFIGNSFTFFNDLPSMVADVAASDSAHPTAIQPGVFAVGGANLDILWNRNMGQKLIRSHHWDYVVLQDSARAPLFERDTHQMLNSMGRWSNFIRAAGSTPVIYETWADKGAADNVQLLIDEETKEVAGMIKAPVVPAGTYWQACARVIKGFPDLHFIDSHHPNIKGDYLTALIFYRYLTGHKPDNVTYVPFGILPEDAKLLIQCASS